MNGIKFGLLTLVLGIAGCGSSELEKATDALTVQYESVEPLIKKRDEIESIKMTWLNRATTYSAQVRKESAEREFSKIALSGALGTSEALHAAKKQIDGGGRSPAATRNEWPEALQRVDELEVEQKQVNLEIRKQLLEILPAYKAYRAAYQKETEKTSMTPDQSYSLKDKIKSIRFEMAAQHIISMLDG